MKLAYDELQWRRNPLLEAMARVWTRVAHFRESARRFYHAVVLSVYRCPSCDGHLQMARPSECRCGSCGASFDPTVQFQRSPCCGGRLVRRTCHYACGKCHRVVPSRFLFDETVFDSQYFRDRMRESRQRKAARREEIRRMLAASRSHTLHVEEVPSLESIPGLVRDLDAFVAASGLVALSGFADFGTFKLDEYRQIIREGLGCGSRMFSAFPALNENTRLDKVRRFLTVLIMCQASEVVLRQRGNDILVSKHEDDNEG